MLKYKSIKALVGTFVTEKTLVGTLSMYKDVKIGELAGWRYWCSPRLMSRGVQPQENRNVYATFCVLFEIYLLSTIAIIDLNKFALLWGEAQLCLPYVYL